jgi:DNA-binding HxlR family transcriptional regulator
MSQREPSSSERPSSNGNGRSGHATALVDHREWEPRAAERALHLLDRKWVLALMNAMWTCAKRHGELRQEVPGISDKVLTETLRFLECDGLVTRVVVHELPPYGRYQLTELGRSLRMPLQALTLWALEHPSAADFAGESGGNGR